MSFGPDAIHVMGNIYCWSDGERHAVGLVLPDLRIHNAVIRLGAWPMATTEQEEQTMPKKMKDLTDREIEIMWLLIEGLSVKAIADRLNLTTHTAKVHVRNAIDKAGGGMREVAVVRFALLPSNIKRARQLVQSVA